MNTTHSKTLRNYMCQYGYMSEIYHFKEAALFEKVTASFIIFRFIKSDKKQDNITLYKYNKSKGTLSIEKLTTRQCFEKVIIPQFQENQRWVLATKEEQEIHQHITEEVKLFLQDESQTHINTINNLFNTLL